MQQCANDRRGSLVVNRGIASTPGLGDLSESAVLQPPIDNTGSTAINAGVTLSTVTTDFDGVSRPQGGVYDIRAYER